MKLSYVSFVGAACLIAGCTSSGNIPSDDGGVDSAVPGSGDSGPSGNDATAPGDDDAGNPANDGGPPVNDGAANDGATNDGASGDLCPDIQGNFIATAVACNGTPITLPTGFSWTAVVSGTSGSFTETLTGCALTSSGTVACANNQFTVVSTTPNTCAPADCSPYTAQCGVTPAGQQVWAITQASSTSFVASSENEPDGGPTPVKTCTAQGHQNPVQVTWTKQ